MESIKVSIVIPVYNLERYISTTISSCLNQTYDNIEVVVVNDGSTDSSEDIINSFAGDKRLIIVNQKNSGVSEARNCGIKIASGDYITFLDGDDTLSLDTVEKFVDLVSSSGFNYKWIFFPVVRVLPSGERVNDLGSDFMPSYEYDCGMELSSAETFEMMSKRMLPVCVGGVFYKTGFIEPNFIKGRFEDTYMVMDILSKDQPLYVSTGGEYRYLHREDSFINTQWTPEKWIDYVRVQLKILDTELKLFPERRDKVNKRFSQIRYNLRYLRFKNRNRVEFSKPLDFFDSTVKETDFNFWGWMKMVVKCWVSLFR